ncbi:N-acyl-D-amino-acid deacylase [Rhodococcus xishaensis]|uniref:N-acyl-D-amino-acid deacylase n=1 Tax=Rhodococcus xishaensis TaxID=2487364 RepID=A0A3S3B7R2_9NOCA|nr:N-acyl-D-amino-acid deacylase [Rhodococcus xishaensis]RVW05119.1 N-acyl-D-amino-acid deacylase [Rhodococcus xishaensis]
MAEVVSINVARVRAAAGALSASVEPLDRAAATVGGCEFGAPPSGGVDPAHEQGIREGYLRLALAIGAWVSASDATGRALGDTADAYARQDSAAMSEVAAWNER